jgi:isoleucyl-tRNA synthetase
MATAKVLSVSEIRASLRLPKTSFPMRANAAQREPSAVARLTTQLYQRQWQERRDAANLPPFVLQDGPPYANGPLHIGHALNKILKDIVNRYHLLKGHPVLFVPGWDCHGLPIELKALESLALQAKKGPSGKGKTTVSAEVALQRLDMTPLQIREAAKAWAVAALNEQRKDFVRWGVLADWSEDDRGIYKTMDPSYEAAQLGRFLWCGVTSRRQDVCVCSLQRCSSECLTLGTFSEV